MWVGENLVQPDHKKKPLVILLNCHLAVVMYTQKRKQHYDTMEKHGMLVNIEENQHR